MFNSFSDNCYIKSTNQPKHWFVDFIFILLIACIAHFLFSPYGFNPTDDGLVLSLGNRLLHHQIPHLDFSSLRPVGYSFLHLPILLLKSDYTILISRFIFWIEITSIAYFSILLIYEYLNQNKDLKFYSFVIVALIFNVHYYPILVFHTIDGLFFATIGFYYLSTNKKLLWFIGAIFIGFATICKQGFVVLLFLSWILYYKKTKLIFLNLFPTILYFLCLIYHHAFQDFIVQISTQHDLLQYGILKYILSPYLYFGFTLYIIFLKLKKGAINFILSIFIFVVALLLLVTEKYHSQALFYLFGFVIGDFIFNKKNRTLSIILLAIAWTTSISVGYNSIALFGGTLLVYSLIIINNKIKIQYLLILLFLSISTFTYTRNNIIYRDLPKSQLHYKLNGIVQGANGIYTNKNTYNVLQELHQLKKSYNNLIALPDFTACQIYQSHLSPILTDWANKTEIPNQTILNKVIFPLKNDTTQYTFAIAKYQTAQLEKDLYIYSKKEYLILDYIENRYKKIKETKYFILYQ